MAVTAWVAVGQGVTPSTLGAVPGVVVNGASDPDSGGGSSYTPPTTGLLYPAPEIVVAAT